MSGLKLSFLISDYGPQVMAQLQREASYRAAFSVKAAGVIERYSKDTHTTPQNIKMVMEEFIALTLPERKGAIAKWVFDAYLNGTHNGKQILAEDLYKIKEDLQYFDALKKSCAFREETDLLKYNGLKSLRDTLVPYERVKRLKDAQRAERSISDEVKADILSETTVLYDGPEGRVVMPHTIKASKYWGNNTKWCISGETTADHYFDSHNQKSPVLMVIPKGGEDDKLAIVANTFWNAADDQLKEIPERHQNILNRMMNSNTFNQKSYLQSLLDKKTYGMPVLDLPDINRYPEIWRQPLMLCRKGNFATVVKQFSELLDNRDFAIAAVQQEAFALQYINKSFREDREIIQKAVKKCGSALEYATPELKADRDIVIAAVRSDRLAFNYAAPKFRADGEIILAAVKADGLAFCFATTEMKSDPDTVLEAVRLNSIALVHASPELRSNPEFFEKLLRNCPDLAFNSCVWKEKLKVFGKEGAWTTEEIIDKARHQNIVNMVQQSHVENLSKYARFMPECWGDAEMVFGTNPDKIHAALKTSPHRASLRRKPEPGVL